MWRFWLLMASSTPKVLSSFFQFNRPDSCGSVLPGSLLYMASAETCTVNGSLKASGLRVLTMTRPPMEPSSRSADGLL